MTDSLYGQPSFSFLASKSILNAAASFFERQSSIHLISGRRGVGLFFVTSLFVSWRTLPQGHVTVILDWHGLSVEHWNGAWQVSSQGCPQVGFGFPQGCLQGSSQYPLKWQSL